MPELPIGYGVVNPRVEFTDADWCRIESLGRIKLSPQLRGEIQLFSQVFVQSHSAHFNAIDAGLIEKRIKDIIDHGQALMQALEMKLKTRFRTVDDWVEMTINKELMGPDFGKVPPALCALEDIIRAAKAALRELISKTVKTRRGPKNGRAMKGFIVQLKRVFEDVGGKVTIGTKRSNARYDIKYETRSVFGDFVHAVYSVLAKADENGLPKKNVGAIGGYIKRALYGKKSRS